MIYITCLLFIRLPILIWIIVRINTTKYPGLKKNFEVTRIPSYLFIKDGKVIKRLNGNVDLMTLTKWINEE